MHPANRIKKIIRRGVRIAQKEGTSRSRVFLDWLEGQLQQYHAATEAFWNDDGLCDEDIPLEPAEIF